MHHITRVELHYCYEYMYSGLGASIDMMLFFFFAALLSIAGEINPDAILCQRGRDREHQRVENEKRGVPVFSILWRFMFWFSPAQFRQQ